MSYSYRIRIRGPLACFTRPEFKTERVSYDVVTPSAARGILESILWKPAIRWEIRAISQLAPTKVIQFKRNELTRKILAESALRQAGGAVQPDFLIDEHRAQRNTVALRDVDYAIDAVLKMTARRGPEDTPEKFDCIFRRRLHKGQAYNSPYLGCREFPAIVERYEGSPNPIDDTRSLGFMLHDLRFGPLGIEPIFFRAEMIQGTIDVPEWPW